MNSIVITNYNGAHLLKKNLPKIISLLEKSKIGYEVIVVDDCSNDDSRGTLEWLGFKENDPSTRLRVIFAAENQGFASTVDEGFRAAKGEYVFTLKTDTVPENADYFSLLLKHFEGNTGLFAVSATLKTVENGKEELRGCGQIYFSKGFFLHRRRLVTSDQRPETSDQRLVTSSWADGSASVFNKSIYDKIGGFDHLYNPFYWEDTDLGFRAWKAGYRIEYDSQALLLHDHEKGAIMSAYGPEFRRFVSLRNQFIFVWKNADGWHLVMHVIWLPFHTLVAIKNRDLDFFKAIWEGYRRVVLIMVERTAQKQINKLSDREVLRIFTSETHS